jgi:hypothetical protein
MKIDKTQIEVFLHQKVEDEALRDAQIARLLHVGTSTVRYWRKRYHIKPAKKFQRKFRDKYGPDALERFDHMVRTRATLQAIAAHFGFTREYARQVYEKLYHASYRQGPVRRCRTNVSCRKSGREKGNQERLPLLLGAVEMADVIANTGIQAAHAKKDRVVRAVVWRSLGVFPHTLPP